VKEPIRLTHTLNQQYSDVADLEKGENCMGIWRATATFPVDLAVGHHIKCRSASSPHEESTKATPGSGGARTVRGKYVTLENMADRVAGAPALDAL